MMTKIEMQAMTAVIGIHRELKKMNEVDWEQRRYDLAKEIFLNRLAYSPLTSYDTDAKRAVAWADCLIAELQKESHEESADTAGCCGKEVDNPSVG